MGYALVKSGGSEGRYQVDLDYGEETRLANIAAGNQQRLKLLGRQATAQAALDTANNEYQTARRGYVDALNIAIELLIASQAMPSVAEIQAEAEEVKERQQEAFDDASAIYATKLADLQAAQSALQTAQNGVDTAEEALEDAEAAQASALQAQTEAAGNLAMAETQLATRQQQVNAAEAEYAAALESGIDIDAKRLAMENQQAALSNVVALRTQAYAAMQTANSNALTAAQAVAQAQADLSPLQSALTIAQAAASSAAEAEQLALANKQVALASLQRAEAAAQEILASSTKDAAQSSAKQQVLAAQNQISQLGIQNQPLLSELRRSLSAIKVAIAQVDDYIARWTNAALIETKPVWCVDYTENGSGIVGTIDINAETDITLIAPGCRQPVWGDGTISIENKNIAIARITARQDELTARLSRVQSELDAAIVKETKSKQRLDAAHVAYASAVTTEQKKEAGDEALKASEDLQKQIAAVRKIQAQKVALRGLIVDEGNKLARWQAIPASESPNYGDGAMRVALTMSPEQSFVNLALLPGVQRHMPKYRLGKITSIVYETDRCSVTLDAATSSQQSLDINLKTQLKDVAIEYMTCNAAAFIVGDDVVIEFESQDWNKPKVIGFKSNPKICDWPCSGLSDGGFVFFKSKKPGGMAQLVASAPVVRYRINDAAWKVMPDTSPVPGGVVGYQFSDKVAGLGVPNQSQEDKQVFVSIRFNNGQPPSSIEYNAIGAAVVPVYPDSNDPDVRNVLEFAVYSYGKLVLNAAITDSGALGSAIHDTFKLKNRNGIDLHPQNQGDISPLVYELSAPYLI
jgi:hypothetical protein